ncbi:unnamed protein product [Auanema sp. JU1783]|nr:unnamed protein product [Auanema sp. JU1783]
MTLILIEVREAIWGRKLFRAPFKVHLVQYNPVLELLALASRKGDIVVKRPGWKKCWKISLAGNPNNTETRYVASMVWNPQGNMLAVGMTDGIFFLINVDTGAVLWTSRLPPKGDEYPEITNMRWHCVNKESDFIKRRLRMFGSEEEQKAMASIEMPPDTFKEISHFEDIFLDSLQQTFLFAIASNHTITVLAGGIVPICVIDLHDLCATLKMTPMIVHDVLLSVDDDKVVISLEAYGPKPTSDMSPSNESPGKHALILSADFTIEEPYNMWKLALTYLRTVLRHRYVVATSDSTFKEYTTARQIFANRINPSGGKLNFLNTLVTSMISDTQVPQEEMIVEKHMTQVLRAVHEYYYAFTKGLQKSVNGDLTAAVRCLAHQLEKFEAQLSMAKTISIDSILFPERNNDVNVYPFNCRENLSPKKSSVSKDSEEQVSFDMCELAEELTIKIRELTTAIVLNVKDIRNFDAWLSLSPIVSRSSGKKGYHVYSSYDLERIWKYMIDTFLENGEYKDYIKRALYDPESIIAEMAEDEEKNGVKDGPDNTNIATYTLDNTNQKIYVKAGKQVANKPTSANYNVDEEHSSPLLFEPPFDKISCFWDREVTDETIDLIHPETCYKGLKNYSRKCSLASLFDKIGDALDSKKLIISKLGKSEKVRWVHVVDSDSSIAEFNAMHLHQIDVNYISSTSERSRAKYNRGIFSVTCHNMNKCVMKVIHENQSFSSPNSFELKLGDVLNNGTPLEQENTNPNQPLYIASHEDMTVNDTIMEIVCANSDLGTGNRRFLKINVNERKYVTHLESFRMNQCEHICISSDGLRGCSLADEQTKIALFSSYEKAKVDEEIV